jgi:hypothetical protein
MGARFAETFFHFFYGGAGGEGSAPIAAGEAVAQARMFLWNHYRNIGGLFYTYVNRMKIYMADDEDVRKLRLIGL